MNRECQIDFDMHELNFLSGNCRILLVKHEVDDVFRC